MKIILIAFIGVLVMSMSAMAKRAAPARLAPIVVDHLKIQAAYETDESGYAVFLVAQSTDDHKVKWKTKLYKLVYEKDLEHDVQDVHLKSLSHREKLITAVDEKNQSYKIDLAGRLVEPFSPVTYSPVN